MTTLKERLEQKAARTLVVQIPVGDPPEDLRRRAREDAERALTAEVSASLADSPISPELAEQVSATAQASVDELAEYFAPVTLRACGAVVWDELLTRYANDDGDVSDEALPEMLAACCVDEELQDPKWWAVQLKEPGWTYGDVLALRAGVNRLNGYLPLPSLGKGSRTTR